MLNHLRWRTRAAYACLRGRPVIAHCKFTAPVHVGLGTVVIETKVTTSPDLTPAAT